ncbi:MAG: hypothetical protein AAGA11_02015 [Pseudomonadota bacterium]
MGAKFFGQFLLEKALISKSQLLLALDVQRECNPTIGALAVDQGYLTEYQAHQINIDQQRFDKRFGDLAVEKGFLNRGQVDKLFSLQSSRRRYFGEILVEQGVLDSDTVKRELALHAEENAVVVDSYNATIEAHVHAALVRQSVDTLTRLFLRVLKANVQVSQVVSALPESNERTVWHQQYHMPSPVRIGWTMNRDVAATVSTAFLGTDLSDNDAVRNDSVAEFLNIVLGHIAAGYATQSELSHLDPPVFQDAVAFNANADSLFIDMSSTFGDFTLLVS